MKTFTRMLVGLLFAGAALMSCNKDDDKKSSVNNYFKVGDKTYTIGAGTLENYGADTDTTDGWEYEGYNIDLALFSNSLKLETSNGGYLNAYGTGQILYFEILTSTGNSLDQISYSYDGSEGPFTAGTFDIASYALNWDDKNDNNHWIQIVEGTLEVSKNGSNYVLKINCTDEEGNKVTGEFNGPLQYFDYSSKKKAGGAFSFGTKRF